MGNIRSGHCSPKLRNHLNDMLKPARLGRNSTTFDVGVEDNKTEIRESLTPLLGTYPWR